MTHSPLILDVGNLASPLGMSISNATDSIVPASDYIGGVKPPRSKILALLSEIAMHMMVMREQPVLSIHEIRKRSKFIRAILKLDPQLHLHLSPAMKALSAELAPYRDAQVNLETYALLVENNLQFQCRSLLESLKKNPYLNPPQPHHSRIAAWETLLADANHILKNTAPSSHPVGRLNILENSFQNFKRGAQAIQLSTDMETVHRWRKKTKRLMYQMRLVLAPEDHFLSRIDLLGKSLGEIHDLDMLQEIAADRVPREWVEALREQRSESLESALDSARDCIEMPSKTFVQMVTQEMDTA